MNETPILIVGAGAAGLTCARELLKNGKHVILVEAQDRAGGRIKAVQGVQYVFEAGAEFVHGDLPATSGLIKKYGIGIYESGGTMERVEDGEEEEAHEHVDHWGLLMQKMKELDKDISLHDFLNINFSDAKYKDLRRSAIGYAEGFDLADINTVSTLALYQEWINEEWDAQYRIDGGYHLLIEALLNDCKNHGAEIHFNSIIKKVDWSQDNVKAIDANGKIYVGSKIILTIPLGVLRAQINEKAAILFSPQISTESIAASKGYGTVTKIIIECTKELWSEGLGFIFSKEMIPTWWTQAPQKKSYITGWLGGSRSIKFQNKSETEIISIAKQSLAKIFGKKTEEIESYIIAGHSFDWMKDPFSLGGYSFYTVRDKNPGLKSKYEFENTIFFAGEGYWDGADYGTVEAALQSAFETSNKILRTSS